MPDNEIVELVRKLINNQIYIAGCLTRTYLHLARASGNSTEDYKISGEFITDLNIVFSNNRELVELQKLLKKEEYNG